MNQKEIAIRQELLDYIRIKRGYKEIAIRQELLDKIEGITGCLDSLVNLSTRDMAIIYFELVRQEVDMRFYKRILDALRKID